MVFQDNGSYIDRDSNNPPLNVIDKLIAQKKIPVMIGVFINPGDITDSPGTPTHEIQAAVPGVGYGSRRRLGRAWAGQT